MTFSQQENALVFDKNGDLKETVDKCAGPNKRVLTDMQARRLARTAMSIKTAFGGKKEQDIEWGIIGDRIFIVQARPYIDKK
jgi:phosphoenolpyruvate synthase/pyruvate phosphate dikinase